MVVAAAAGNRADAKVTGQKRLWIVRRVNVEHDCARAGASSGTASARIPAAPQTEDDDGIVGMAMDAGNLGRIRLERDRADYFSMTTRGVPHTLRN